MNAKISTKENINPVTIPTTKFYATSSNSLATSSKKVKKNTSRNQLEAKRIIKKVKESVKRSKAQVIAVEGGETGNIHFSKAGMRAMNTVSPYVEEFTKELLKFSKEHGASEGGNKLVNERISGELETLSKKIDNLEATVQTLVKLIKQQSSQQNRETQAATLTCSSTTFPLNKAEHNKISFKLSDINTNCIQLVSKPIAGMFPPQSLLDLSKKEVNTIRRESSSSVNFAINLFRIAYTPTQRYKMSCTGQCKGPIRYNKTKINQLVLDDILKMSKEENEENERPNFDRKVKESIDGNCRALFNRAKRCRQMRSCNSCARLPPLGYNTPTPITRSPALVTTTTPYLRITLQESLFILSESLYNLST